jgi:hypothetical protein
MLFPQRRNAGARRGALEGFSEDIGALLSFVSARTTNFSITPAILRAY